MIDDDDDTNPDPDPDPDPVPAGPRTFTLRIENTAPWSVFKMSSLRTRAGTRTEGNLRPGEAYETRFTAAEGHRLSFAMAFQDSNDWFFAPEPDGIPLFTNGAPISGDITNLIQLWDAGTELDQEPGVGEHTGLKQTSRELGEVDTNNQIRLVPAQAMLGTGAMFQRPEVAQMIKATIRLDPDGYFTFRVENISTPETLVTSAGTQQIHVSPLVYALHRQGNPFFTAGAPAGAGGLERLAESSEPDPIINSLRYSRGVATPLFPGLAVVHRNDAPLFTLGSPDYGLGLEAVAEDGMPTALNGALAGAQGIVRTAMFDTPVGDATVAGPAYAGQAFETTFEAEPGDRLSFATMFGASNDWFFAPGSAGIELFHGTDARWGDLTSEVRLYDLGTESDEELDVGSFTGVHQDTPDAGRDDGNTNVREVTLDRYDVPEIYHLRVTLTPAAAE